MQAHLNHQLPALNV